MRAVAIFALAGCYAYEPGSFRDAAGELAPTRATIGCLDVAVAVHTATLADGPVVDIGFGNRCRHAATIDLTALKVRGRDEHGAPIMLVAYDPRQEIRSMELAAREAGRESIEFDAPAAPVTPLLSPLDEPEVRYLLALRERLLAKGHVPTEDELAEATAAMKAATEKLARPKPATPAIPIDPASVCVDVGAIAATAAHDERWLCASD